MVEFLLGRPAQDLMTEAVQLEDLAMREAPGGQATVFTASRTCHGLQLLWAGELDAAREVLHQELAEYESLVRHVVRDELLTYLAEVECRAGNWDVAARHAQEAYEIDIESGRVLGLGHMLFPRALVAGHKGDVDRARSDAEEGLRRCLRNEDLLDANCNRAVLGFLELSLVKGEVERRARQKRAARSTLEQALGIFQALGAPLWAQRARDDLARVGGAVLPSSSELTPTEQRIAQLVGEGMKNREVADALFISVKTVEANLSRIFHKLGVRSRTELSRRIAATHRVSPDSSPPHEA
jgi:DNA-binding CsgD family transcriptional regulator